MCLELGAATIQASTLGRENRTLYCILATGTDHQRSQIHKVGAGAAVYVIKDKEGQRGGMFGTAWVTILQFSGTVDVVPDNARNVKAFAPGPRPGGGPRLFPFRVLGSVRLGTARRTSRVIDHSSSGGVNIGLGRVRMAACAEGNRGRGGRDDQLGARFSRVNCQRRASLSAKCRLPPLRRDHPYIGTKRGITYLVRGLPD